MREWRGSLAPLGHAVAFVPTMGALHAGHMALVQAAKTQADTVIASIFVNPAQFGEGEDFDAYPRTLDTDKTQLEEVGVDALWLPRAQEIYPDGFVTSVHIEGLSNVLCGAQRPGHFDGVATVVAKLLNQVQPHLAYFGEKDFQQLTLIRRMVEDLNMCTQIIRVPTYREADGLAMSSRNRYLSEQERRIAPILYKTLQTTRDALFEQPAHLHDILTQNTDFLIKSGFQSVDYLALVDVHTLTLTDDLKHPTRLCVAAHIGAARLIDNIAVDQINK